MQLDHRKYIRDPGKVQANLRELEDGRLVTIKGCKIVIPARFTERNLAFVGIETKIVGIYAMIIEDQYYSVSIACAMMDLTPSSTTKVIYDGDEYYEFTFDPGATVVPTLLLVKTDTLTYSIYDELLAKGRSPWYLGEKERCHLFDTAVYHAGANIGQQHEVTELIVSLTSRDAEDRTVYFRHTLNSPEDLKTKEPVAIPLNSVTFAPANTLSKLTGGHAANDGLLSALATPTERVERIEDLLRR
jgi:hypothetical protein